jgi:hypothetical protein
MPLELWLILAGSGAILLVAVVYLLYRAGQKDAENTRLLEEAENAYQARKEANRLEADIRNMPDNALDDELRNSAR